MAFVSCGALSPSQRQFRCTRSLPPLTETNNIKGANLRKINPKKRTAMSSRRDRISLRKLVLTIWLATLMLAIAQPVRAEVRVSGNAAALIVETREASVDEVLAALRTSFNIQYHTSGAAVRVVTGSYTGSLRQVLARLFDGQNYVIRSSANGIEIAVFGPGASSSGAVVWGRQQPSVVKPPDLLPPVASPAKAITKIDPNVSRPPVAAPAARATSSVPAPANPVATPAVGSPQPVLMPPVGNPNVEGWNGEIRPGMCLHARNRTAGRLPIPNSGILKTDNIHSVALLI